MFAGSQSTSSFGDQWEMSNGKFSGPRAAFEWGGRALQLGKQETFRLVCTELAPLVVQFG